MFRRLSRFATAPQLRQEQGSVTVMVVFSLVAVMGLAALVTDVGRLYLARQRVVAVADAAALSGAQFLPGDRVGAVQAVREYLGKNGVDPDTVIIGMSDTEKILSVTVELQVDYTFARILGHATDLVRAGAVAQVAPVTGFNNVTPLGVVQADWKLGDPVILKASSGSGGTLSPGNYGPLALGSRGANTYENNLRNGYGDWIRAGDMLTTETGNMAQPTQRALQDRLALDPFATYETVSRHSPRILILPVLESFTVNGRGEVKCVGFGAFFLDGVGTQGNDRGTVYGRFLRFVVTGESTGEGPDFATYTIKLTH
ncbi:MAG TPA: Tad domain-containing protein [Symbiobacteriaceae bacterium]|nr:Tad domain-containing protein [Symbiobacteriaceae bacterium]